MASRKEVQERISEEFSLALKEYAAFDRTLNALGALAFILHDVDEISAETSLVDFKPKIESDDPAPRTLTPDGLIIQKMLCDYVLELKTSWNDGDVQQLVKYGRSAAYIAGKNEKKSFNARKCCLLGYQNTPGESNLTKLFDAWQSEKISAPLVLFRYSLEQGAEGDRMYFARVPFARNGSSPDTYFGKAINGPAGFSVSADNFKRYRSKFHKANDQVIASYAAVIWWTKYAKQYLSDDQKSEMAARGRLSTPLDIRLDDIASLPTFPEVEVTLGRADIRRALDFLRDARLVSYKRKEGKYEVFLKEDRYIRLPQGIQAPGDISSKILARWATHKVKNPPKLKRRPKKQRARRDNLTLRLF